MDFYSSLSEFVSVNNGIAHFCDAESFDELFAVRMRDFVGNPYLYTVNDFAEKSCDVQGDKLCIRYSQCAMLPGCEIDVIVKRNEQRDIFWNINITCGRDYFRVEWVDYPRIKLKKDSSCRFLIPCAEGVLISDLEERQKLAPFKCNLVEYAYNGVDSFYPGAAAAQFEAVYDDVCGLYIGCHDKNDYPKTVDFMPDSGRARILLQHFTEGKSQLSYDVVTRSFEGNWQDAADIYRNWLESADIMPEKLADALPEVLAGSPVVIAYPVKGFGSDAGGLIPNEYYPYMNGLPVMERYSKLWNNSVMALLMHWEGTAPWAPPFIWPPSGGEALLKEYVDAMHSMGNTVGLYSSGIAWTQKSMIDPNYSLEERFVKENVADEICTGPRGEAWSSVCNSPVGQRIGYDLCPSRDYTAEVVCKEISSASSLGIDYLQYFDQNQGCVSPLCYSKKHGHPDLPGAWQTRAMQNLLDKAQQAAGKTVIGCENAAAQPYVKVCKLNDLRNHLAWGAGGVPVALYSYLYHEYTSGFSGNGVWLHGSIDLDNTPYFPLWNLAWNFVSGNLLSVVLKDKGEIHWNWCRLWSVPAPEQEPLIKLIGNLAKWRRTGMKQFLVCGRMVKTPQVISPVRIINTTKQTPPQVPAIVASAWQNNDDTAVILANSLTEDSVCTVVFEDDMELEIVSANGREQRTGKRLDIQVPALDALLINCKKAKA